MDPCFAWNCQVMAGVGVVQDIRRLYSAMHAYLASAPPASVQGHSVVTSRLSALSCLPGMSEHLWWRVARRLRGWREGGLPVHAGHDRQQPRRRLCAGGRLPQRAGGIRRAAFPRQRLHQLHVPLHQRPVQVCQHAVPRLPCMRLICWWGHQKIPVHMPFPGVKSAVPSCSPDLGAVLCAFHNVKVGWQPCVPHGSGGLNLVACGPGQVQSCTPNFAATQPGFRCHLRGTG